MKINCENWLIYFHDDLSISVDGVVRATEEADDEEGYAIVLRARR